MTYASFASYTFWCYFLSHAVNENHFSFFSVIFLHFNIILGMNQLLWYYADLEKQKCLEDMKDSPAETMFQIGGRKSSKVFICHN